MTSEPTQKSLQSRARSKPGAPFPAERHAVIVELMKAGEWVRGSSAPPLAEQWGLSVASVERTAAGAWAEVIASTDPDVVKVMLATTMKKNLRRLDEIASDSEENAEVRIKAIAEQTRTVEPMAKLVGAIQDRQTVNVLVDQRGRPTQEARMLLEALTGLQGALCDCCRPRLREAMGRLGGSVPDAVPAIDVSVEQEEERDGE